MSRQKRISNINILIIFLVSILCRVLFVIYHPRTILFNDSLGYFHIGQEIAKHLSLSTIINEFRTPLYPIFLTLTKNIGLFNDRLDPHTLSDLELSAFSMRTILLVQHGIGLIGVGLFIILLSKLKFSKQVIFILSLLYGSNILLFSWERSIMTEAIASPLLILYFVAFVRLQQAFTAKNIVWVWVSYTFNFLLRPVSIILPFATIPFLFFLMTNVKKRIILVLLLILCTIVPTGYIMGNKIYHQYTGISRILDVDLLGSIIEYQTPLPDNAHSFLRDRIYNYRLSNFKSDSVLFFESFDNGLFSTDDFSQYNTGQFNEIQAFVHDTVRHNFLNNVTKAISMIPSRMVEADSPPIQYVNLQTEHAIFNDFIYLWVQINIIIQLVTLSMLPLLPLAIYLFFRKRTPHITIILGIGLFIIFQIFATSFITIGFGYQRIFSPLQPFMYIFIVGTILEFFKNKLKQKKKIFRKIFLNRKFFLNT